MASGRMSPMKAKMLAADKRERKKAAGKCVLVPTVVQTVVLVKRKPKVFYTAHKVPVLSEHVSAKLKDKATLPHWGMAARAHEVAFRRYLLRAKGPEAVAAREALIPLT